MPNLVTSGFARTTRFASLERMALLMPLLPIFVKNPSSVQNRRQAWDNC